MVSFINIFVYLFSIKRFNNFGKLINMLQDVLRSWSPCHLVVAIQKPASLTKSI